MNADSYFNRNLPFPQITMNSIHTGPAPFDSEPAATTQTINNYNTKHHNADFSPDYHPLPDFQNTSGWNEWSKEQELELPRKPVIILTNKAKAEQQERHQLEENLRNARTWNKILCVGIAAAAVSGALCGIYWQMSVGTPVYLAPIKSYNSDPVFCPIDTINTGTQCKPAAAI